MSILNVNDDAKAIKPLIDAAISEAGSALASQVAPALGLAMSSGLKDGLDGLTCKIECTISFSKK